MILGEPTLQSVIELLQDDRCPRYGELPIELQVSGPDEIVLECDHVVDATIGFVRSNVCTRRV